MKFLSLLLLVVAPLAAETLRLTLAEARALALKNQPQIQGLEYSAQATLQVSRQIRALLQPQVTLGLTGNAAIENSRFALGSQASQALFNRVGAGVQINQLITDFGRLRKLGESNDTRASAEREGLNQFRLVVLARVDRAWFSLLRARAVERVAQQTLEARKLIVDQVTALADAKLRSTLDLSFAKVNLADAKLLLTRSSNEAATAESDLATAIGLSTMPAIEQVESPDTGSALPDALDAFVQKAFQQRPDLKQTELELRAARQLLEAEQRLRRPTVSVIGAYGAIPAALGALSNQYGVLSLNVLYPLFNGRQFEARQSEVALRIRAAEKRREEQRNLIAQEIRSAYFAARTAAERLAASRELLEQATLSLDLAQTRYDLGLGSIVELSQAQLTKTAAAVGDLAAQYDDRLSRLVLLYLSGEMGQ